MASNTGTRSPRERLITCSTLGGRCLLLQRLPLLGDQPRVLHRDHRLGGKVLQQRDLLVGEGTHFLTVNDNHSQKRIVFAQRDVNRGAPATEIDMCPASLIARAVGIAVLDIIDMNDIFAEDDPVRVAPGRGPVRFDQVIHQCGRHAARCDKSKHVTVIGVRTPISASHSRSAFSSIASNTGARLPGEALITCNTSAVAVCCSSASRCLGDQPRVLDRDDRLIGECADRVDLPSGERPNLNPSEIECADHNAIADQWDTQNAAHSRPSGTFQQGVFRVQGHVHEMDKLLCQHRPTGYRIPVDRKGTANSRKWLIG